MDTHLTCKPCTAYIWPTSGAKVVKECMAICVDNRYRYVDHDRWVGNAYGPDRRCVNSSKI